MSRVRRTAAAVLLASALTTGGLMGTASTAAATTTAPDVAMGALASCGYYSGTALTMEGNTGNRVREIQCLLNRYSGYPYWLDVDGIFGNNTESGVRWLQRCAGIAVDGLVGPDTWWALRYSSC